MLDKEGAQFNCKGGELKVICKDGSFMFLATLKNYVYHVFPKFSNPRKNKNIKVNANNLKKDSVALWHFQFAHIGLELFIKTRQNESIKDIHSSFEISKVFL